MEYLRNIKRKLTKLLNQAEEVATEHNRQQQQRRKQHKEILMKAARINTLQIFLRTPTLTQLATAMERKKI